MNAAQVGLLLRRLNDASIPVTLTPAESTAAERLITLGYLEEVESATAAEEELRAVRHVLAEATEPDAIRDLRERALGLSEVIARNRSGVSVSLVADGGPYRGSTEVRRLALTYRGRALLADLGPRAERVERLTLADFETHMAALRGTFADKSARAAILARHIAGFGAAPPSTVRSVAVGLASHRDEPEPLAQAWNASRRIIDEVTTPVSFTAEQSAAAAESLVFAPDPTASARELSSLAKQLVHQYCNGSSEDALDAALLLTSPGAPTLEAGIALGRTVRATPKRVRSKGIPITLSGALRLLRCNRADGIPDYVRAYVALHRQYPGVPDAERYHAAVTLALVREPTGALVERTREIERQLDRFGGTRMLVIAAHLALLPIAVLEALDLVRLAAGELQRERLVAGGPEMIALGVKMVLQTAQLAAGSEGDREESLALARFDDLALERLGQLGVTSSLPLVATTLTAFHTPVLEGPLDAPPLHSPGLFSSGGYRGGSGWG